ncbi:MAG: sigma 54-interacting transcriptional regulator [Peptococcaceae bacterium]|nr:sigma 54-interacting transcriptional regulator [Peptococcaceae bacterium]
MKRNFLLFVGSFQELREFGRRAALPEFLPIRGILLYPEVDGKPAENGFKLPPAGKEPAKIYESPEQLPKTGGFDLVLDFGGRLKDAGDLGLPDRPFLVGPCHLERFYQFIGLLQDLDYYRRMLEVITVYATEGIQIADAAGNFIYCNDASFKISDVEREEREGRNAFEVQRDGAISRVLTTQKPVYAHLSYPQPKKPVVSNASPIYNEKREIVGAVTVFNDASNAGRLAQALQEKKEMIASLKEELSNLNQPVYDLNDLVGVSEAFLACLNQARQAAFRQATVLITGESGTGKELFAHGIHRIGNRANNPFIKVNCPASPSTLLESELFGYEKGAFTGAGREKPGKFELADGGSIFLDEVGDMELILQSKLLRVLQEHEVERLGSNEIKKIDVRVIAATNQDLLELVQKGLFRKDLYYRLDVIHIHIPPLRERRVDIPVLVEHLLKKLSPGRRLPRMEGGALEVLTRYDWPGNVREMENFVAKLSAYQEKSVITRDDVLQVLQGKGLELGQELTGLTLEELEKQAIQKALEKYGNSLAGKRETARSLGISLSSLYDRIKKFGLQG